VKERVCVRERRVRETQSHDEGEDDTYNTYVNVRVYVCMRVYV